MHKQDNIYFYSRNVPEKPTYVFSFSVGPIAVCAILNDPPVDTHDRFMFIPHNHAFFECQLIEKGPVYLSAQNNEYTIEEGCLCLIHPFEYHTYLRPKDPVIRYQTSTVAFLVKSVELSQIKSGPNYLQALKFLHSQYFIHNCSSQLAPLFDQIKLELAAKKPGYSDVVRSLAQALITRIFGLMMPDSHAYENQLRDDRYESRGQIIDRFFRDHIRCQPTLKDLADSLHISERRTSQVLQELYNCSFSEKLMQTRIEIAKLYLRYSAFHVADIATICGFQSQHYFYTSFKKRTGQSPLFFRHHRDKAFTQQISYDASRASDN